jgi:hypothetical protein
MFSSGTRNKEEMLAPLQKERTTTADVPTSQTMTLTLVRRGASCFI